MSFLSDFAKTIFPIVLSGAKSLADSQVDGLDLNEDQRKAFYSAYVEINVWFDDIVNDTENEYDNAGLEALSEFLADTLQEAGIDVPEIPEDLFDVPEKEE